MNKAVRKELHRLMDLCMEINEKTEHGAMFSINSTDRPTFDLTVWEHNIISSQHQKPLTCVARINFTSINKCRQKLLKYKE